MGVEPPTSLLNVVWPQTHELYPRNLYMELLIGKVLMVCSLTETISSQLPASKKQIYLRIFNCLFINVLFSYQLIWGNQIDGKLLHASPGWYWYCPLWSSWLILGRREFFHLTQTGWPGLDLVDWRMISSYLGDQSCLLLRILQYNQMCFLQILDIPGLWQMWRNLSTGPGSISPVQNGEENPSSEFRRW